MFLDILLNRSTTIHRSNIAYYSREWLHLVGLLGKAHAHRQKKEINFNRLKIDGFSQRDAYLFLTFKLLFGFILH